MHHICIEVRNFRVDTCYFNWKKEPSEWNDYVWQVNDIHAAIEEVRKNNIRTLTQEPRIGAHGTLVIFLHPKDCCGTLVELEQDH